MSDGTTRARRRIGRNGPEVLAVGLGCMSLSGTYGTSDDEAAIPFLHRAIALGVDFLDSSDAYGLGQNEEVLGRALKGRRDKVVLATKFGQDRRSGGVNGRPEYVQQACDASLKRLGVEVIDLYYQHRVDPAVPVEDTVGAMSRLVEQGKVRFLGLCEARPDRIRRGHAVHPIAAVQSEFSLLYREVADETRATTRDLGISFVAYSPLGRSLLAGVIPDFANLSEGDTRKRHPRFEGENFQKNRVLVERAEAIAADKECTVAQALACLAAGARPRRDPDPGHQAHRAGGGEPRRSRCPVDAGGDRQHRRSGPGRCRRRAALSRRRHEGRVYLNDAPLPHRGRGWPPRKRRAGEGERRGSASYRASPLYLSVAGRREAGEAIGGREPVSP